MKQVKWVHISVRILLSILVLLGCKIQFWMETPTPGMVASDDILAPETLLPTAGPLCEAAFSSPVAGGLPMPPVLTLINLNHEEKQWAYDETVTSPDLEASSIAEVQTLVCIRENLNKVGSYNDGQPAYELQWEVRLVSWPDGEVLGIIRKDNSGPGIVSRPIEEFLNLLTVGLRDKMILYIGSSVEIVAFSPNGNLLASASCAANIDKATDCIAKEIWLWDVMTRQVVHTLSDEDGSEVTSLERVMNFGLKDERPA